MIKQNLEIMLAMQDDAFQTILENDEIIQKLEKQKYHEEEEYWQLMTIFTGKNQLGNTVFNTISLGMWAFLYSIKNPYIVGGEKQRKDTDLFLYLLYRGFDGIKETLFEDSKDFCIKHEIGYTQASLYLLQMIDLSFRPLQMIGQSNSTGEPPHFNLEWVTMISSIVYRNTGCDRHFILYKMSLLECMYYVINELKRNDVKNTIKRRNSAEIDGAIFQRTYELGQIYYNMNYKNK